jgi:hypothetical protein
LSNYDEEPAWVAQLLEHVLAKNNVQILEHRHIKQNRAACPHFLKRIPFFPRLTVGGSVTDRLFAD